jgi:ParB-like chromosome segregation protein Spo0J
MNYERLEGFVLFPIADITVPEFRQRNKAEADDALVASIESTGLLNPIILHGNGVLVAGERRLDAFRKLKKTHIPARVYEKLSAEDQYEAELQENLARKQFTWQEEVKAIGGYHHFRLALNQKNGGSWTQMGTATALGLSQGYVSQILAVFAEIEDEEVLGAQTMRGAFNLISGRAERAKIAAQSRGLIAVDVASSLIPNVPLDATKEERTAALLNNLKTTKIAGETVDAIDASIKAIQQGREAAALLEADRKREIVSDLVINADFLQWAESYTGPKFDVIHVDFPWGKDYSGPRTRRTGKATINPQYNDSPDIFFSLVDGFLALQDSFAFDAAHCLFWLDMRYYSWTIEQFTAAGWNLVSDYPYQWMKGYLGIASDVKRRPRHCYESALMFSRGDRKIVKLDRDYSEHPLDPEKLHLNQKPIAMLKHFLGIFVDEHTAVLDPTCGSGSALEASMLLGAARVLGVELDSSNADVAKLILQRTVPAEEQSNEE